MQLSKTKTLLICIGGFFITGCGHSLMRGSVVMKVSDTQAQVCLGNNEVKVGDHLQLYKNICSSDGGRALEAQSCKKIEGGRGEVTRLLNEHYSVVSFPKGTVFAEGDIIEKTTRW